MAVVLLAAATLIAAPSPATAQANEPFTIVVLPDTQRYLDSDFPGRDQYFVDQVDWTIAERANRDIVFVSHVGDIVQREHSQTEWDLAYPIFDRLHDSGIPFGVAPGNHDLQTDASGPAYDALLPASRFANDGWYRGNFDNNRNSYQVVSQGGDELLFLHVRYLRYGSMEATLDWARDVLESHPNHLAFVTTHEFGGADGNVISFNRRFRDEVLSPACNVVAVFAGHIHTQARGSFTDQCGRSVPHMVSNYQHEANGGNGYLRVYEVDPSSMRLEATTYSPTLDRNRTDAANSFTVQSERPAGEDGVPQTVVARSSNWRYFNDGAPPSGWNTPGFSDGAWPAGTGEFGFGDGDEATLIDSREPNGQRIAAAYFRTTFSLNGPGGVSAATVELLADDGAIVWLNGQRVVNDNMTSGTVAYETPSQSGRWGSAEQAVRTFQMPAGAFVSGTNTIAVEVHQRERSSSDLSFDASVNVTFDDAAPPPPSQPQGPTGEVSVIDLGADWRYFDDGAPPANWSSDGFNDDGWPSGRAELGFGDQDQATTLDRRVGQRGLFTAYFRHEFTIAPGTTIDAATLGLLADDGAVVWVNSQRLVNDNMTTGPVSYETLAQSGRWGSSETDVRSFSLSSNVFRVGINTVAIEVHQREEWSSDLSFDAELTLSLS